MKRDFENLEHSWTASAPNAVEANTTASIGPSISVRGEISGSEDLVVEGYVEGTISLMKNAVTVSHGARVKADIYGKKIRVLGEVSGDLAASEQIIVEKTGNVRGNITAPRITLQDGARIKGAIDTEPQSLDSQVTVEVSTTQQRQAPQRAERGEVATGTSAVSSIQ